MTSESLCKGNSRIQPSSVTINLMKIKHRSPHRISRPSTTSVSDDFDLPTQWHILGPFPEDHPPLPTDRIARIPDFLEIGGKRLVPRLVQVEQDRLDLAPHIGGTIPGKTAYVYIPFEVSRSVRTILGFGADWWFAAWLDGAPLLDTLKSGNSSWPPTAADYCKQVEISKGRHLLTIRFISGIGSSVLCAATRKTMPSQGDGPSSSRFTPHAIQGDPALPLAEAAGLVSGATAILLRRLQGGCISWGIPFSVNRVVIVKDRPVIVPLRQLKTKWLVFLHASEELPLKYGADGFLKSSSTGPGQLGEPTARYVFQYADGSESPQLIRLRFQIGMNACPWGEAGIECVPFAKPSPLSAHHEQRIQPRGWGSSQTRVVGGGFAPPWVYAWENPHPAKAITAIRIEPMSVPIVVFGITAGDVSSHPLRWESRRKAVLTLPDGEAFLPDLDSQGLLQQVRIDMGQVISARHLSKYDHASWTRLSSDGQPSFNTKKILVEYTAHPEAAFHLSSGRVVPVKSLGKPGGDHRLEIVPSASHLVKIQTLDRRIRRCVPVRLHVHGQQGEYLAPVDRHRIPNANWFEDYSADYVNGAHPSTYISGETTIFLPPGRVYLEVTKGFETKPVRKVVEVKPSTRTIIIELTKVLPWRERGWVTADTHVHFLSPQTALLEGEAEGVNVVNLLASQWGELMTNVGDFDGRTTLGSREAGGSGEYLVRVGTENRQRILGHISLLGYEGGIIAPMTTGGPDESALGDPVWTTLTEWAEQCRRQKGVVVIPHFPSPRLENAAAIVSGNVDAIELGGVPATISPYSLSDWYRYLNCGYRTAAVAGTDKMGASQAVGKIRTYAWVGTQTRFTYEAWKNAVRQARTFATTGPLMEFMIEGKRPGAWIKLNSTGGTVSVAWEAASITTPMARVDLIRNGEIIETAPVKTNAGQGTWEAPIRKSAWLALLVRDARDQIVAHSSPVMIEVQGTPFYAAADALTILDQLEGALAYLNTLGTRAETRRFKAMKLKLTAILRALHNRMHQVGEYHHHAVVDDHVKHHHR